MKQPSIFSLCVALFLPAVLMSAAQRPYTPAGMHGIVLRAGSGDPVPGATLTVRKTTGNPAKPISVRTDSHGRFEFRNLNAGSYFLTITKDGYIDQTYGQHVDGTPVPLTLPSPDQWRRTTVPPIELSPGQIKWDMVVRLTPAAIVRGRIRDDAGQPIAALRIELLRRRYTATGILTFQIAAAVSSDELGKFRFDGIPPGRYYVTAGVSVPVSIYGYTYFPGVTEVEKAVVIDVQPGSDWNAIDFAVGSQKLFRVRGRLMDSRTGQPPPQATINIYSTSPVNPYLSYGSADYDAASGAFERTGLPPGTYRFSAVPQLVLARPGLTAGPGGVSRPSGAATVRITESDINDQLILISEAPVITGRISVEGSRPTSTTLTQSGPQLRSSQGGGPLPTFPTTSSSSVTTDGVLRLLTIAEGEFVVTMSFLPDGLYLKQARLNGTDVLTVPASFSQPGDLQIVLSTSVGTVEGTVTGDNSALGRAIPVVFVPNEKREIPELFKLVFTDDGGRFSVSSIAPGDYKVFAWEWLEIYSYFDPEFLKPFEASGKPIHISESSRQTIEVNLIPRSGAR